VETDHGRIAFLYFRIALFLNERRFALWELFFFDAGEGMPGLGAGSGILLGSLLGSFFRADLAFFLTRSNLISLSNHAVRPVFCENG